MGQESNVFQLSGKEVALTNVGGEVISVKTWSETDINSSTMKNVHSGAQWVSGISSTTSEITDVIFKTPEGKECSERLYNSSISAREGNSIVMVYANQSPVALWNKNQEKFWTLNLEKCLAELNLEWEKQNKVLLKSIIKVIRNTLIVAVAATIFFAIGGDRDPVGYGIGTAGWLFLPICLITIFRDLGKGTKRANKLIEKRLGILKSKIKEYIATL